MLPPASIEAHWVELSWMQMASLHICLLIDCGSAFSSPAFLSLDCWSSIFRSWFPVLHFRSTFCTPPYSGPAFLDSIFGPAFFSNYGMSLIKVGPSPSGPAFSSDPGTMHMSESVEVGVFKGGSSFWAENFKWQGTSTKCQNITYCWSQNK